MTSSSGRSWKRAWPAVRARALAHVAEGESKLSDGRPRVDGRLALLLAEGDVQGVRELVRQGAAHPETLAQAAQLVATEHPAEAAEMMKRVVDFELKQPAAPNRYRTYADYIGAVLRWAPGEESRQWLEGLRRQYKARRKLMSLLEGL